MLWINIHDGIPSNSERNETHTQNAVLINRSKLQFDLHFNQLFYWRPERLLKRYFIGFDFMCCMGAFRVVLKSSQGHYQTEVWTRSGVLQTEKQLQFISLIFSTHNNNKFPFSFYSFALYLFFVGFLFFTLYLSCVLKLRGLGKSKAENLCTYMSSFSIRNFFYCVFTMFFNFFPFLFVFVLESWRIFSISVRFLFSVSWMSFCMCVCTYVCVCVRSSLKNLLILKSYIVNMLK